MSEQVALYEATDAREGALVVRTVVVLTTIGAKSGNNPKNPVMRIRAAPLMWPWRPMAGAPETLRGTTLCAHPEVLLQDAGDREIPVMTLEPIKH